MAKKLYVSGNYVIADFDNGIITEYPKAQSAYNERNNNFNINEDLDEGKLIIPVADSGTWFDEAGTTPFTEATLRTFLRANTGNFNTPVSVPGLPTVLGESNITDGNPITLTLQDKLQGFPSANYINFNDSENDGIFIDLLSGNGFARLFEAVTWINNATLVRLQSPGSIQLITEVFRLRDFSSNFESQINMDKLTANRSHQVPDANGVFALESSINETLTFGGGLSGDVATLTVTNGIITARTLVP